MAQDSKVRSVFELEDAVRIVEEGKKDNDDETYARSVDGGRILEWASWVRRRLQAVLRR